MQKSVLIAAVATLLWSGVNDATAAVQIDADYPGGNIIVERIDGNVVELRQDPRDTPRWWFYWNFRVRGAAGETLTFRFTNKNVIGTRGPAISFDEGRSWSWLGMATVQGASFRYRFAKDAHSVRFAFAIPYQQSDLERFLARYDGHPNIARQPLCTSPKGRPVERIDIGDLDGQPDHRVVLTCRHHACESAASYVLEGMMAALLADTDDGRWFRRHVEVLVVPFMDTDGVEDGDQGKGRMPRDHCRDYSGQSLYPSVAALRKLAPRWSEGRLRVALDLHSPSLRDQAIYLVGSASPRIWNEQQIFSSLLESSPELSLPYRASDNLPFGKAWNVPDNYLQGKSFSQWAGELDDIWMSATLEIPYANVGEVTFAPDAARGFGSNLVHSLRGYLEQR